MNVTELFTLLRSSILDDTVRPYLWSDAELVFYLNEAVSEFCRETLLLKDETSVLTEVKLLSNVGLYPLDEKVLLVWSARRESDGYPLTKKTESEMSQMRANWRNLTGTPSVFIPDPAASFLRIYPKYDTTGEVLGTFDISFDAARTITRPTGGFLTHFAQGDEVNVSGTVSNNRYVTVASLTDTVLTVKEPLVDEAGTSAILRKVRDKIDMVISRAPLVALTLADLNASPEIKAVYHGGLLDGMAKRAYLKQDSETLDPRKAAMHTALFQKTLADAKRDGILLSSTAQTLRPRLGSM